ncbi:MAG: cell division protein FtsA [Alphaproteobacteria bacterium]|nr:MAG: cell division protein FtsA [Alphaproteobacteria bacterium]
MASKNHIITAVDIGSYKISGAVFEVDFNLTSDKVLNCLSAQMQRTQGLSKGILTNFSDFENSILNVLNLLERESRHNIHSVYISLSGNVFTSYYTNKSINLMGSSVTQDCIQRLINEAYTANKSYEIVHIAPVNFKLDDVDNIENPNNMIGDRLTVSLYVMTAPKTLLNNLRNLFARYDIKIESFVAAPVATILCQEFQKPGVILDFGHDSTSIVFHKNNTLMFHCEIPLGGNDLIKKIAQELNISFEHAERMKSYYGYISSSEIELNARNYQNAEHNNLNCVIRRHIQELVKAIKKQFDQFDMSLYATIDITGGLCELKGFKEYIEDSLCRKTRILTAQDGFKISSFTTCFGLIRYGYYELYQNSKLKSLSYSRGIWQKIKNWFNEDL